jgi:hypothetical protein
MKASRSGSYVRRTGIDMRAPAPAEEFVRRLWYGYCIGTTCM